MWLVTMFDLPVKTTAEKRDYTRFRNFLLEEGFSRLQYSVYARFCTGEEVANRCRKAVKRELPPEGHVRVLTFTDAQFGKMQVFTGQKRVENEQAPKQVLLF